MDGAEQLEMKKYSVYERTMHSLIMSSLASVGPSESPTSSVSSQRMLYRRLGENEDDEFHMDQRIMVNMIYRSTLYIHLRCLCFYIYGVNLCSCRHRVSLIDVLVKFIFL